MLAARFGLVRALFEVPICAGEVYRFLYVITVIESGFQFP